ncbi:phospholipase C [Aspergillus sp. HF37]|nr:phospholipase C [Aspergillus sp. HF37]
MTSPASPSSPQIRVLTLNCWGLKYLATHRRARLHEIGRQLGAINPPPEIVGLQECWTQEDYEAIRRETREILPHGKFYFGGVMGAGLAILSRWPIVESAMYGYPLNGRPTAFFRGDWFVGKGVACARIRLPGGECGGEESDERGEGEVAAVFCTHLHAPYEREPNDSYLCHRTAQAWEIAKLMRSAAERGDVVIGLGDFNMLPSSFAHRLIVAHAPVQDAWSRLHPDSSLGAAIDPVEKERGKLVPSAEYNLLENGVTCDSCVNTWRWTKEQMRRAQKDGEDVLTTDRKAADPRGKRLDYIFVGGGWHAKWGVDSARVTMTQPHYTLGCSLSDHFAVEAVISGSSESRALTQGSGLTPETYDLILDMIDKYGQRERTQRRWRLGHFVASVLVSIGCFVGVWWTGDLPYVAFVLVVVSTLNFGAGILDGLIGGLFVSSELRALKEFEWEVRNARRIADAGEKVGH